MEEWVFRSRRIFGVFPLWLKGPAGPAEPAGPAGPAGKPPHGLSVSETLDNQTDEFKKQRFKPRRFLLTRLQSWFCVHHDGVNRWIH